MTLILHEALDRRDIHACPMPRADHTIPIYQVDAFTAERFRGNPAAVCPLDSWLPDDLLFAIAAENNLSETAYLVREGDGYRIRWFTPTVEVELCGHATLASAFVVMEELAPGAAEVRFESRSGPLGARRDGDRIALDFPAQSCAPMEPVELPIGATPRELYRGGGNLIALFEREAEVRALAPDLGALGSAGISLIVTAPAADAGTDFVSRYFAPAHGVPEDPVTGSAHCALAPLWGERLGKRELFARQISARGGELWCTLEGDRVTLAGGAVLYLRGTIHV
jgi:predicted PhzF superfamily epimerase YddE/YHI9